MNSEILIHSVQPRTACVPLTQERWSLIDVGDINWVSQNKWCVRVNPAGNLYACRGVCKGGRQKFIHLHQEVFSKHFGQIPPELEIDHINHNSLDNRLENLRAVTRTENNRNRRMGSLRKKSGLPKGVFRGKSRLNPFISQITYKGRTIYLGSFPATELAAEAFNKAHKEIVYANQ